MYKIDFLCFGLLIRNIIFRILKKKTRYMKYDIIYPQLYVIKCFLCNNNPSLHVACRTKPTTNDTNCKQTEVIRKNTSFRIGIVNIVTKKTYNTQLIKIHKLNLYILFILNCLFKTYFISQ